MMNCPNCLEPIDSSRIQLGYKTCVKCSDVEAYGCVGIINHKTGNTVQVVSKSQANTINKHSRKRFGTAIKFNSKSTKYNPKNTLYGCSTAFIGNEESFNKVGEFMMYMLDNFNYDEAVRYIERQKDNYVINANQLFKLKQLLNLVKNQ